MVSKKSLKAKVPVCNKRKGKYSQTNGNRKHSILLSQKVIINSIFDESLFDRNVKADLPANVNDIFHRMLADIAYINETQTKKDYSFYDCNMTFIDGEKMISSKRKAVVQYLMLKEGAQKPPKDNKKVGGRMRKATKPMKVEGKPKSIDLAESSNLSDGKGSEFSSDNNLSFRPQRKRKKPLKYKTETNEVVKSAKETPKKSDESKQESLEEAGADEDGAVDRSVANGPRFVGKAGPKRPPVIDLAADDNSTTSSGGGLADRDRPKAPPKSKIYFREPTARKSVMSSTARQSSGSGQQPPHQHQQQQQQRRLKEHTLLDKLLLGVNCVRHWTDRGLQLGRLCEADLALLNKRMASLDCSLADLEEHTDDNNNRSLSVLLKSELFSAFVVPPATPATIPPAIPATPAPTPVDREPVADPVPDNRQKQPARSHYHQQQQHVPAMYRPRHATPSILARPPTTSSKQHSRHSGSARHRAEEMLTFSSAGAATTSAAALKPSDETVNQQMQQQQQLTASQLLRLRSTQKCNLDAVASNNQNQRLTPISPSAVEGQQASLISVPGAQLGLVRDTARSMIFQSQSVPSMANSSGHSGPNSQPQQNQQQYLPNRSSYIIMPQSSLVQPHNQKQSANGILSNVAKRQQHVNKPPVASKSYHTVTTIQRLQPLPSNLTLSRPLTATTAVAAANYPSQQSSVILKNLLQQASNNSNQVVANQTAISTDKMMPLSVFQNSKSKRPPFVSFNHYSLQK